MIILYNPHVNDFLATPPHFWLLKRRALKKYGFFIPAELERCDEVRVLVDGTISVFIPIRLFSLLPGFIRNKVAVFEYFLWHKINKFDNRIKRVSSPQTNSEDTILAFSSKAAAMGFHLRKQTFLKYKHVVFHLSHYFVLTGMKAKNLQELDNVWLAGDSDITLNTYFKRFFAWYNRKFLILPFSIAPRFHSIVEFDQRKVQCIATGSFHDLTCEVPSSYYADYMTITGKTSYHPIRREIYERRSELKDSIYCKISPYRPVTNQSIFKQIIQHFKISQKDYFALDIVALYNQYKFAIVGEELSGFPALGALEAMSCGCVLIGNSDAYIGLGLIKGIHYIQHDDTVDGAIRKIKEFADYENLAQISQAGMKFVTKNFNVSAVYTRWIDTLSGLE